MRTPHRALAIGGLILLFLSFDSAHPDGKRGLDLGAREARIDSLVKAGLNVESFSEAVKLLRECVATYGPTTIETTRALRATASALSEFGDIELAASMWHLTQLSATETLPPCDTIVPEAMVAAAVHRRRVSPDEVAVNPIALEAISMLDPSVPEQRSMIARIKLTLAFLLWRRDLPRSIDMFEEAVQLAENTPDVLQYCAMRFWLGWTLVQAGRHDEARYHLERARDEIAMLETKDPSNVGQIDLALGELAAVSGDWTAAETLYRSAAMGGTRKRLTGSSRFVEPGLQGFHSIALIELKRGRAREAWESLQRGRGTFYRRLRSLDQVETSPGKYARIRELRKYIDENRDLRRQWHLPQTLREVDWERVLCELEANAELFELEAMFYAPEISSAGSLEDLQSVLPDNYAYVGWLNCRFADALLTSPGAIWDECWMYVVRSHGPVHWIPLWKNSTVEAQHRLRSPVGTYGGKMANAAGWALRVDDDPSLSGLARTIADMEFAPALPFLDGVDCLVVEFLEDRVAWKPLEALVLPDGRYVGDRFDVAYSPNADAFVASRRTLKRSSNKVLVVGDPVFDPEATKAQPPLLNWGDVGKAPETSRTVNRAATNGDASALGALPPLRYAKLETDHIRKLFPDCTVLCGVDATEPNVRRILQGKAGRNVSILHFATHALTQTGVRQRHALALTRPGGDGSPMNDGLVDGLEVQLGWNLDADLVTLSGCRTLDGWSWSTGEPTGLAGLMLGAGARSVLATYWPVDDLAVARLNARFYDNLTGRAEGRKGTPMSKAAALSEAKRWLRTYTDENGKKPFAHPVYWSGFILIGDPR